MVNAVVLAGGKSRIAGNKSKATLNFWDDRRCIDVVVECLDKSRNINKILISGDKADLGESISGHEVTQERRDFFQSVVAFMGEEEPLFYIYSDIPFINSIAVDDFLERCDNDADLNFGLVGIEKIRKGFAGYKDYYPYTRFNDFGFRLANCALVYLSRILHSKFEKRYNLFRNAYDIRRFDEIGSITKFIIDTGPIFLYSLLSKSMNKRDFYKGLSHRELYFNTNCREFEELLFRRSKLRVNLIKSSYPELAVDVDTKKDKEWIEYFIGSERYQSLKT